MEKMKEFMHQAKVKILSMDRRNKITFGAISALIVFMLGLGTYGLITLNDDGGNKNEKLASTETGKSDNDKSEAADNKEPSENNDDEKSNDSSDGDTYTKDLNTVGHGNDSDDEKSSGSSDKSDNTSSNNNSSSSNAPSNGGSAGSGGGTTNNKPDTPLNSGGNSNTGNTDKPSNGGNTEGNTGENTTKPETPSTGGGNTTTPDKPSDGGNSGSGDITYEKPTEADKQAMIEQMKKTNDAVFNTLEEAIAWAKGQRMDENSKWYGKSFVASEFGQGNETYGAIVNFSK